MCDNNNTQSIADYLAQLLKDKKQLQAFPNVFLHLERLLDDGKPKFIYFVACHRIFSSKDRVIYEIVNKSDLTTFISRKKVNE